MQRILTLVAFVTLLAGTAVAAVKVTIFELGSPAGFGRTELQAWLTASQSDPSPIMERRAARQLDRDFHAAFDWQPVFEKLPPAQQAVFEERFQRLLALLFRQRADAYEVEPRRRRDAFLDQQLRELSTWYVVRKRGKLSGLLLLEQVVRTINSPTMRGSVPPHVREFLQALGARAFEKMSGGLMKFGGDEPDAP